MTRCGKDTSRPCWLKQKKTKTTGSARTGTYKQNAVSAARKDATNSTTSFHVKYKSPVKASKTDMHKSLRHRCACLDEHAQKDGEHRHVARRCSIVRIPLARRRLYALTGEDHFNDDLLHLRLQTTL